MKPQMRKLGFTGPHPLKMCFKKKKHDKFIKEGDKRNSCLLKTFLPFHVFKKWDAVRIILYSNMVFIYVIIF